MLKDGGYDGFYSLEWVKRWDTTLEEPGIVFAHFANYMRTPLTAHGTFLQGRPPQGGGPFVMHGGIEHMFDNRA